MKLIGGILPFLGFRDQWVDRHTAADLGITQADYDMEKDAVHCDVFEIEWLCCGVILATRGIVTENK